MASPARTDGRELLERFWSAVHANDFAGAGRLLHDDYILEWPQSGERILGRDSWVEVNRNYPADGPWRVTIHRLLADEDEVVSVVTVTDGTVTGRAVTFSTVRDGLIWRQTEYWPEPFPPPLWRAQWVERREEG